MAERRSWSLTVRLLLGAGVWITGALIAGGFVLSAAFRSYVETDFDERLGIIIDSMVGASELAPEGFVRFTRPLGDERFALPYSGWYWQVSEAGRDPFRSRSLWDQALDTDFEQTAFTPRMYETTGPDGQLLRISERDIILPDSERVFRYMAAGDTAEIREDIARFDRLLIQSLSALGLAVLAAMVLQVTFGLRPLRHIRIGLANIRSGRAERLAGQFPPEIVPLVDEMNALIEHNAEVVERARTHVGNLAHALKTPLSVISNEAETAAGAPLADTVQRQTDVMRTHIDHHLKRARAVGGGTLGPGAAIDRSLGDIARAMRRIHRDRALDIQVDCPAGLAYRGERQDLDEMIGNLLDNACKWAGGRVWATARPADGPTRRPVAVLIIEDDGPGVGDDEREALFERGKRLDESKPGSGLGLAIVRDIAELSGGGVALARSEMGGLKVTLTLPMVEQLRG